MSLKWWSCRRKKAFQSGEEALQHIWRDYTLDAYKCKYCPGWHIGHWEKKDIKQSATH